MERYKDSIHAFRVGYAVRPDVRLAFSVCLRMFCLSVCHRLCLTVLLYVRVHQCLAAYACVFLRVFLGCVCPCACLVHRV